MHNEQSLSQFVAEKREKLGLSQSGLAKRSGLELSEIEPLGIDMLQFGFEELELSEIEPTERKEVQYNDSISLFLEGAFSKGNPYDNGLSEE